MRGSYFFKVPAHTKARTVELFRASASIATVDWRIRFHGPGTASSFVIYYICLWVCERFQLLVLTSSVCLVLKIA